MRLTSGTLTKALIGSIAGGLILSIAVVWGVGIEEVMGRFLHASAILIAIYLTISLLISIGLTLKWRVALRAYGVKMPFYTLFIYRIIGYAVAYLTPAAKVGGEPVRALLLSKQGVPTKISFSSVVVEKTVEVVFSLSMFFLGALLILNFSGFPLVARISIFAISLLLLVAAAMLTYGLFSPRKVLVSLCRLIRLDRKENWPAIERGVNDFEALIEHFYENRKSHFRVSVLISALLWVLMFMEYKFALLILGYDASIPGIFLFLTGVGIAYSIPIPGALGVLELGQISAAKLLGVDPATAIALAFLIRLRDIAWTILGLILLTAFHLNVLNLFTKSQEAAKRYNFESLSLELSMMRQLE